MRISRRTAVAAALAWTVFGQENQTMYGLIGRMKAVPGKRGELAAILLEGTQGMPGCLSYIVAEDASDPDALWISEVWESEAAHKASLSLPSVKEAIAKGRPLIGSFDEHHATKPVGGVGLGTGR